MDDAADYMLDACGRAIYPWRRLLDPLKICQVLAAGGSFPAVANVDSTDRHVRVSLDAQQSMGQIMSILKSIFVTVATALAIAVFPGSASAQLPRTWVSSSGNDSATCLRATPCKTFTGVIAKTAAGGTISVVDPGDYGTVTITKSITIDGEGVIGDIVNFGTTGILIDGADVDVVLSNLVIDGTGFGGAQGIQFSRGRSLILDNVTVRRQTRPNTPYGLLVNNIAGTIDVTIRNSMFSGNGFQTGGSGIQIAPTTNGSANVSIQNTTVTNNVVGIRADASGTTGSVDLAIVDSVASENTYHGIVTIGGTSRVFANLVGTSVANNLGEGLRAVGPNSRIRVSSSLVTGNGTGVVSALSGRIESYGDNRINGNTIDGAVSLPLLEMN